MRGDEISLGYVYVYYYIQNEILETIFSREELHYDEWVLEGEVENSDDDNECNENNFPYYMTISA